MRQMRETEIESIVSKLLRGSICVYTDVVFQLPQRCFVSSLSIQIQSKYKFWY